MSDPVRFVTGVSLVSVRSPVRLREVDRIKDFSVCARCIGATTAPSEESVYRDIRTFSIWSETDEFITPDSVVTFTKDCAIKFQEIRLDYDLSGFVNGVAADGLFYGFVAFLEVNYRDDSGRTVLLTHVFDMSHTNESFVVRDFCSYKVLFGNVIFFI